MKPQLAHRPRQLKAHQEHQPAGQELLRVPPLNFPSDEQTSSSIIRPRRRPARKYWRSLGQLADTPEFRGWLEREFPQGAAEMKGGEVSRRNFLQLMGASTALAGLSFSALPPAGKASRAVHAWRGVVDPRQGALLRHVACPRGAAQPPLVVADVRWPPDEDRRQPAASGEQRRDGHLGAVVDPRSLRPGSRARFPPRGQ